MSKYTGHMFQTLSVTIHVDADDAESAIEVAYDRNPGGILAAVAWHRRAAARKDGGA